MANDVSRIPFSGSTQFRGIKVAATATPGTLIHTTGVTTTVIDSMTMYVTNSDTTARKITVEFGGVTAPDDNIEVTVPAESGLLLVLPGMGLVGTGAAGNVVRVFCATANVVVVFGFVDRITP